MCLLAYTDIFVFVFIIVNDYFWVSFCALLSLFSLTLN